MTESCCSKRSGADWRALGWGGALHGLALYRRGGRLQQGRRCVVQQPGVNTHSAELVAEAIAALTARATRRHGRRARLQRGGGVAWGGTAWCRVQRVVCCERERGWSGGVRGEAWRASCRGVVAAVSCPSMVTLAWVTCLADELACMQGCVVLVSCLYVCVCLCAGRLERREIRRGGGDWLFGRL